MALIIIAVGGLSLCAIGLAWTHFMLARNQWVYRQRMAVLNADYLIYKSMPSYETMMRKWWIWDAAKFIGTGNEARRKADALKAAQAKLGVEIIARKLGGK